MNYVLQNVTFKIMFTEAYLEPSRTSKMKLIAKIDNDLQPLIIFIKKLHCRCLAGF